MANVNAPQGLRWIGDLSIGLMTGAVNEYVIPSSDSNNYFINDPVRSTGTSTADGIPTVQIARASGGNFDTMRGVIVGFKVNPDNLTLTYGPASTTRTVYVVDQPYAMFAIQTTGTVAITDMAANADLAAGAGSTITGISGYQLDLGTITPTATAQMRIIRKFNVPNNEMTTNAVYVAMINEHEFKSTTGV